MRRLLIALAALSLASCSRSDQHQLQHDVRAVGADLKVTAKDTGIELHHAADKAKAAGLAAGDHARAAADDAKARARAARDD